MSDPIVGGASRPLFYWARFRGRFSALPANGTGLAIMVGLIVGNVLIGLVAAYIGARAGTVWWIVGYFLTVFPAFFLVLWQVIRTTGQQVTVEEGPGATNVLMNQALRQASARGTITNG